MKNKNVEISFKKLLGNGRAWSCPTGFTAELLNILVSPLSEVFEHLKQMKFVHFVSITQNENNIINNEDLFGIQPKENLEERAEDVELAWQMLTGNSNYKTLENYLQRAGFEVYIYENTSGGKPNLGQGFQYNGVQYNGEIESKPAQYGGHSGRVIGNGFLDIEGKILDPVNIVNGKHTIYIKGYFDPTDKEWERIVEITLKFKPAHVVAVCQIVERKKADNGYPDTVDFVDRIDGGYPDTTFFEEKLNKYREE